MYDITLPMLPSTFAKAKAALLASKDVLSHSEASETTGRFQTKQVALMYTYDAPASPNATGMLGINVLAKFGFAKMAGNDTIRQKLIALLASA